MSTSPSVLRYKQIDDGFSNPNTVVNMRVLDWLCVSLEELLPEERRKKDLLEMYCGNGNHTVALSSKTSFSLYCNMMIMMNATSCRNIPTDLRCRD